MKHRADGVAHVARGLGRDFAALLEGLFDQCLKAGVGQGGPGFKARDVSAPGRGLSTAGPRVATPPPHKWGGDASG
jgi:hypothetical protein